MVSLYLFQELRESFGCGLRFDGDWLLVVIQVVGQVDLAEGALADLLH